MKSVLLWSYRESHSVAQFDRSGLFDETTALILRSLFVLRLPLLRVVRGTLVVPVMMVAALLLPARFLDLHTLLHGLVVSLILEDHMR